MVSERETELRNAQEQSSKLQTELNQMRQDLQEKTSQEEVMRKQISEKEEKTRKAFLMAKQKISQLMGKKVSPGHIYIHMNVKLYLYVHSYQGPHLLLLRIHLSPFWCCLIKEYSLVAPALTHTLSHVFYNFNTYRCQRTTPEGK